MNIWPNPETTELAIMTNVTAGRNCRATILHCCLPHPDDPPLNFTTVASYDWWPFCHSTFIDFTKFCTFFLFLSLITYSKLASKAQVKPLEFHSQNNTLYYVHSVLFFAVSSLNLYPWHIQATICQTLNLQTLSACKTAPGQEVKACSTLMEYVEWE